MRAFTKVISPKAPIQAFTTAYVAPPEFKGEVQAGKSYLIVDDTLSVDGTIATFKGYIENNGGKVMFNRDDGTRFKSIYSFSPICCNLCNKNKV